MKNAPNINVISSEKMLNYVKQKQIKESTLKYFVLKEKHLIF